MAQAILVNGVFAAGKTTIANQLVELLCPRNEVRRVVDGPHLVDLVTVEAHGASGSSLSNTHFHRWNATEPLTPHHHWGRGEKPHFPFTVIDPEIGGEMFKRFAGELVEASKGPGWVVAELGTGQRVGCQTSQADFSTETFVKVLKEEGFWLVFKEIIGLVVAVEADWETRLMRNRSREQVTDGITSSWGMQEEGLRLTYESDLSVLYREGLSVLTFDNNQDGPEGTRQFIEREVVPLVLREGAKRKVEFL